MPQPKTDHKGLTYAYVALGGNATSSAGSPDMTLRAAKQAISCESVNVLAESRLFRTPAFPAGTGADFANAVIAVETSLSSGELLAHLHRVEARFERVRQTRWGARTLDLDLLDFGGRIAPDEATVRHWIDLPLEAQTARAPEQLLLPHPRLQDRAFVLIPMADIAPDWVHPLLGISLAALLDALPQAEKAAIVPLEDGF